MTVALGIHFCCSTSIDLPLYYICSILYYWDDTIAQIMYCTVQIPRVGIIFVHHGGVMTMVNDECGSFYINIIGIFK